MCDKGNQTEREMSSTTPPTDHRPSYFRMDWMFVRHPQLALERDFWKSQLFKCKHVCLYPFERFDGADIPTVIDMYPQLVKIIEEQICTQETFTNLKVFAQFMMEYVSQLNQGVSEFDEDMDSPLHFASANNRLDILQILARNASSSSYTKMDLNFEGIYEDSKLVHNTVLGEACANNRLEIIEFYISLRDIQLVDFNKRSTNGFNGCTLFHQACGSGHVEVVKLFLRHADELNIDLNARSESEGTPFMMSYSKDVLQLLLEDQRIDVNAMDDIGYTALLWLYNGPGISDELVLELVEFLLQSPRIDINTVGYQSILHIAGNANEAEVVFKAATKRYIDANRRDPNGRTPAHYAFGYYYDSKRKYVPVQPPFTLKKFDATVEVFLKYAKYLCIDFEATDDKGRTPLHYMYQTRSKEEVAQFLESAKKEYNLEFNINALDHDGKTPIQLSEKCSCPKTRYGRDKFERSHCVPTCFNRSK